MTKDEALKLALEALDALYINDYSGYEISKYEAHIVDDAITALRQALEQPSDIEAAVKKENEACAKLADSISDKYAFGYYGNEVDTADEIAAAIRERMK